MQFEVLLLDFTTLVRKLKFVLDLFNEMSDSTTQWNIDINLYDFSTNSVQVSTSERSLTDILIFATSGRVFISQFQASLSY